MSDQRLRDLHRQAMESGDPEDALTYRMLRIRMGEEQMPERSYGVLELHLKSLKKKISSYAKRAHKHGQIPLALHVGARSWVKRETPSGRVAQLAVIQVTMIGDPPTTQDWSFISALHHTPSGTVIQRAWGIEERDFPEQELVRYRDRDSACEHCNLRRRRNDTYVLRNRTDGTVIQVGRTCLGEFLSTSPEAALYQFKTERVLTEMLDRGLALDDKALPEWGVDFVEFLAHLNAESRRRMGQVSRYLPGLSWRNAFRYGIKVEDGTWPLPANLEAQDLELAEQILAEAREHLVPGTDGLSQDDHNLAVIVAEGTVSSRHATLAATVRAWFGRRKQAREDEMLAKELEQFQDPVVRAREIRKAITDHVGTAIASGTTIAIAADDLARLILANGELDQTRARLRTLLGIQVSEPQGDYLGDEDQVGTWTLTVSRLHGYDDRRSGVGKVVVNLEDPHGRTAVWFAAEDTVRDLEVGATVRIDATISRHGHNRYTRKAETVLTKVKLRTPASASNGV